MADETTDLQQFVAETLRQIIEGVRTAQADATAAGAIIAPACVRGSEGGLFISGPLTRQGPIALVNSEQVQEVEFDVAVTIDRREGTKAGIAVVVAGIFGAGGQRTTQAGSSAASRIKFQVPARLPRQPGQTPAGR